MRPTTDRLLALLVLLVLLSTACTGGSAGLAELVTEAGGGTVEDDADALAVLAEDARLAAVTLSDDGGVAALLAAAEGPGQVVAAVTAAAEGTDDVEGLLGALGEGMAVGPVADATTALGVLAAVGPSLGRLASQQALGSGLTSPAVESFMAGVAERLPTEDLPAMFALATAAAGSTVAEWVPGALADGRPGTLATGAATAVGGVVLPAARGALEAHPEEAVLAGLSGARAATEVVVALGAGGWGLEEVDAARAVEPSGSAGLESVAGLAVLQQMLAVEDVRDLLVTDGAVSVVGAGDAVGPYSRSVGEGRVAVVDEVVAEALAAAVRGAVVDPLREGS